VGPDAAGRPPERQRLVRGLHGKTSLETVVAELTYKDDLGDASTNPHMLEGNSEIRRRGSLAKTFLHLAGCALILDYPAPKVPPISSESISRLKVSGLRNKAIAVTSDRRTI
jgi:hypothetical protein